MRLPSYTRELKAAVKAARHENPAITGRVALDGTAFRVKVESVRIRPSGGPCRAWAYWYSIVGANDCTIFGAIDRADTFVSEASRWLAFRLMTDDTLTRYVADGWTGAKEETARRQKEAA